MKSTIKLVLTFLLVPVFIQSCTEQTANIESDYSIDVIPKQSDYGNLNESSEHLRKIDDKLNKLARLTAIALQDTELRLVLAREIEKQTTGDYEALFSDLRKIKIKNRSFTAYLALLIKGFSNSSNTDKQDLHNLLGSIPKLHFAMPVHFDSWRADEYVPVVSYAPNYPENRNRAYVDAYNKNGNHLELSTKTPPTYPVIVIGVNERVGNNIIHTNSDIGFELEQFYVQPCDYPGCDSGTSGGSNSNIRKNGALDYIYKIKATNIGQWESWLRGKLDLWLQVAYENGGVNEDKKFQAKRGDIKEGYNPNLLIRNWYPNEYGKVAAYEWRERDYGGTYTHTWTYNKDGHNIVFEFKHEGGDEYIGTTVVHFNDPPRRYDLGDFDFWLDFQN